MQFVINAYDYTDDGALERRMAARSAHVEMINQLKANNQALIGAAILDDNEKMIGSVIIGNFETRAELNQWLEKEPYVTGKVWERIEVKQLAMGPSFKEAFALAWI